MERYKPRFKVKEDAEEDKSIKAIQDLIDMDWEKDEDAQHTALALIKGLVLADTKSADKFLTDLSTYTSKMSIEDYSGKQEEGCKKKPKKKGMKEAINITNPLQASDVIATGISYLTNEYNMIDPKLIKLVANGIYKGIIEENISQRNPVFDNKYIFQFLSLVFKNIKNRVKQG